MQTIEEQMKERVYQQQEAVAKMRVYRRRMASDDGWEYQAAEKLPGPDWNAAPYSDVITIACRALTGNF